MPEIFFDYISMRIQSGLPSNFLFSFLFFYLKVIGCYSQSFVSWNSAAARRPSGHEFAWRYNRDAERWNSNYSSRMDVPFKYRYEKNTSGRGSDGVVVDVAEL